MNSEPESLVLPLLREIRETRADLKADIRSLRADVTSDFLTAEAKAAAEHKQTREQIVGLRRAVIEYHTTAIDMAS